MPTKIMNGKVANEVIIGRIALDLVGISFDLLTVAEKSIGRTLQATGWVTLEGEDKVIKITPYGAKYIEK
jgi:hypothetical protein